jgi:putative endonuclease
VIRAPARRTVANAMTTGHKQHLGRLGEQLAAQHFERLGYRVLARNHRTRWGELDLVLADEAESVIVFCEVKTRRLGSGGSPWDNLHDAKQEQVRKMSTAWLVEATDRPFGAEIRYDAIGVIVDRRGGLVRLDHLEAAF